MADPTEILQAIATMNTTMANMNTEIQAKIDKQTQQLQQEIGHIKSSTENKIRELDTKLNTQERKVDMADKLYRQHNVLIHGMPEKETNRKSLEEKIIIFLNTKLEVKTTIDEIDFIRRLGAKAENKTRPIQIRFLALRKTQAILANRGKLKNTSYQLLEDFPKAIIEERKKLIPFMKKFREQGLHAVIKYNKLIVDGKEIKLEEIEQPKPPSASNSAPKLKNIRQLSDESQNHESPNPKQPKKDARFPTIRRNSFSVGNLNSKNGSSTENLLQYFQKTDTNKGSESMNNPSDTKKK